MAFNTVPSTLFGPAYAADPVSFALTITDFPGLTGAMIDTDTGDGRAVLYCLLSAIADRIDALPAADKPQALAVRSVGPRVVNGAIRESFEFSFDRAYTDDGMAPEPT